MNTLREVADAAVLFLIEKELILDRATLTMACFEQGLDLKIQNKQFQNDLLRAVKQRLKELKTKS